jgi:hypothetical protein
MEDRNGNWAKLGRALLVATMSHGWQMIVGVLAIILVTYAAVIVLVSTLNKGQGKGEFKIVTPFLTVIRKSRRGARELR